MIEKLTSRFRLVLPALLFGSSLNLPFHSLLHHMDINFLYTLHRQAGMAKKPRLSQDSCELSVTRTRLVPKEIRADGVHICQTRRGWGIGSLPHGDPLCPHLYEVYKTNNKYISFIIINKGLACIVMIFLAVLLDLQHILSFLICILLC